MENNRPLRGFATSQHVPEGVPEKQWEDLSRTEKIERAIKLMSKPGFVKKHGIVSGDNALVVRLENEPGLASEISKATGGREAIISFITKLYRSENGGHSSQSAIRARTLFALEETSDEQARIRDAELDCRASVVGSDPYYDKDEWLQGLTDAEVAEVNRRATRYSK